MHIFGACQVWVQITGVGESNVLTLCVKVPVTHQVFAHVVKQQIRNSECLLRMTDSVGQ